MKNKSLSQPPSSRPKGNGINRWTLLSPYFLWLVQELLPEDLYRSFMP